MYHRTLILINCLLKYKNIFLCLKKKAAMYCYNELKDLILKKSESDSSLKKEPQNLYEPVSYLLSIGGKRIRPVLTLMVVDLFEGNVEKAVGAAYGIEMFHNFTLMHDDIMDKALFRRGFQTVHKKWNENTAILSGDAMLLLANQLMLEVDDDILREVMVLYNKTGLLVCEGQQYDMNYESEKRITTNQYIEMIRLKTAVLLGGCLKLGAVMARTTSSNKELIDDFGVNLGISFQIEDDYLDSFGDFEKFGKNIGGDILSNKKTFLLVKAYEMADAQTQKELDFWINNQHYQAEEKIKAVKEIYTKLNIDRLALEESKKYFNAAIQKFEKIEAKSERKKELYTFAHLLIGRQS